MLWEQFKQRVYSQKLPFYYEGKSLGDEPERVIIDKVIQQFADAIAQQADAFLEQHGADHIDQLVMTGGGSQIPQIPEAVYSLLRVNRPRAGNREIVVHVPGDHLLASMPARHVISPVHGRGASALGCASVFFGHPE